MSRSIRLSTVLACTAAIAACHSETGSPQNTAVAQADVVTPDAGATPNPAPMPAPSPVPTPGTSDVAPAPLSTPTPAATPAPATDPTPSGAQRGSANAAVDVVHRYYALIDAGDFRRAYALWSDDGKASHQSFEEFRQGFAKTRSTSVTAGTPGRIEGAAGSSYITIPVSIDATQKDGTRQHFTGSYVLRRVNDVPGSSAADRRWHLFSASLHAR